MTRRRSMHALLGTLALIAGCSTAQRTEVTGVVRDRSTGRVIAGARVIGADGALARTDAHGRFTLYIRNGRSADVRVSAEGHASEHVELAGLDAHVELSPTSFEGESFVMQPDEVSVLSFGGDAWSGLDAGPGDGSLESDIEPSHVSTWISASSDATLGASTACVGCHDGPMMQLGGPDGSHAGLADACLACHAPRLGPDARASCGRCHGSSGIAFAEALAEDLGSVSARAALTLDRAIADAARTGRTQTSCGGLAASFTQVSGAFVLVDERGVALGDCDEDGVLDAGEQFASVGWLGPRLATRARMLAWLEADGSHGAHAPELSRAFARSLAE